MKIFELDEIRERVDPAELILALEQGFVAYSEGSVVVPPVGHLYFKDPPGECHIKYGFALGDEFFVIKVATGFYKNSERSLPSNNGLILVFSQQTGVPIAILLDEGYLTDIRTAAAGAVVAKYLAPKNPQRIGIVGTGIQARLQLEFLRHVVPCRDVMVWGRNPDKTKLFEKEMTKRGFVVVAAPTVKDLCTSCNLIVTTTPSRQPILQSAHVLPGTHITAVGADGGGKQELEPMLFRKADICVVDSLSQCREYGDSSYALKEGLISEAKLTELGQVIKKPDLGRRSDGQITIADLTGVAVQDIQAASILMKRLGAQIG